MKPETDQNLRDMGWAGWTVTIAIIGMVAGAVFFAGQLSGEVSTNTRDISALKPAVESLNILPAKVGELVVLVDGIETRQDSLERGIIYSGKDAERMKEMIKFNYDVMKILAEREDIIVP